MVGNEPGPDARFRWDTDEDSVRDPMQFLPGSLARFSIWHVFKDMGAKHGPELVVSEGKVVYITVDLVTAFTRARVNVGTNIPTSVGFDLK